MEAKTVMMQKIVPKPKVVDFIGFFQHNKYFIDVKLSLYIHL
jgi:hypothetical protein